MSASPAKSFRAAAQRVLEQETAQPDSRIQTFAAPRRRRSVAHEPDAWDVRLSAMASLGAYDAIAAASGVTLAVEHSWNIADPRTLPAVIDAASVEAARTSLPVQLRATVDLADGRTATALLVTPLSGIDGADGILVGVRVGRVFDARDGAQALQLADLLAIELLRSSELRSSTALRRQALALYELSRIAIGGADVALRLQDVVEMLAGVMEYDVAQLWQLRHGGSLRLVAAHPRDSLDLEIARPRDQDALSRALDGETVRVADASLRYLIRRTARELVVAPLGRDGDAAGLLVLGRWRDARDDDASFAAVCADFIADALAKERRRAPTMPSRSESRHDDELLEGAEEIAAGS